MVALVSKPELAAAVTALFVAVAVAGVLSYRLYIARHPTRRRAAFDIGSGATKLLVADVAGGLISARLLEENIPIAYKTDAQHNGGHLSNEIQEQGLALLGRLVEAARGLGAVEACAIATEVFRTAPNGDDFLERIRVKTGLEVRIIDQAAEAALGLATAEALGAGGRPSWDSGGGSFQITARGASDGNGEMRSFTGRQGTLTALRDLYDIQGKKDAASVKGATPNPTNKKDAESLLTLVRFKLGDAPAWLDGASVVGIGGLNSLFPVALRALRGAGSDYAGATLSLAEVQRAFEGAIGKSDDELLVAAGTDENSDPPAYVVPKLALMLAVFERTKVAEVEYQPSVGGCEGLLCAAAGEFGAFVALQA